MIRRTFFMMWLLAATAGAEERRVSHELTIVHPGDPRSRPMPVQLEQGLDATGDPTGYSMWVDSVICRDEQCEVVQVQLHWDALGRYARYRVEDGRDLTKLDHVPFSKADHAKLHGILNDRESPLKEVTKEGLTGPRANAGVDGIAGATLLTLKSTVVVGAGYTCYDLWHWANGEVSGIVRKLSGTTFSPAAMKRLLESGETDAIGFALVHMTKRKLFDPAIVSALAENVKLLDKDLTVPLLDYLRAASPDDKTWFESLIRVFHEGNEAKRVQLIERWAQASEALPKDVLDRMSEALPDFTSHHEVHLFLNLMQRRNPGSTVVAEQAARLLDHRKFFIARRAYWFLEEQDVPDALKGKVEAFEKKYEDRL